MKVIINGQLKKIRMIGRDYDLDTVTRKHTAFESYSALINSHPSYRPSICLGGKSAKHQRELISLSINYNDSMRRKGDARRVFTGDWSVVP